MIEGKDHRELRELEEEIQNNLDDPDFIDQIDYWYTWITKIKVAKAKSLIENLYQNFIKENEENILKGIFNFC